MIASSIARLPVRVARAAAMPFMESTLTSVVEPPMTTIMQPRSSSIGTPAPSAAATGVRSSDAFFAPAARTVACSASSSTRVQPCDTDTASRFFSNARRLPSAFSASARSSAVASSILPTAPSITGDSSVTSSGVRPSICRASRPTARISSKSSRSVST